MKGRHGHLERRRGVRLRSGKGSLGDTRSRAVRRAIAASLLLHCLVAAVAVAWKPRPPSVPSEVAISVDIAVGPGVEESANAAPSQSAATARSVQPARPGDSRAHGSESGRSAGARMVDARAQPMAATSDDGTRGPTSESAPAVGAPLAGRGWQTFQPSRPDLTVKPPLADEKRRDLLALPSAPKEPLARELPRQLQGGAGVSARVGEDGSIRFHDPKGVSADVSPSQGLVGHFDLTDHAMKMVGQDPYASVKARMAEETREQRLCMAERYRGERQKHELFQLSTKVRHIAAQTNLSAVERRALVFEIWDECLEDSDSPSDYGAMARATILAVVREVFPEGTDLGYRPAELLALNGRRTSRGPFAPYTVDGGKHRQRPDAGASPPSACP